ncbi:MAG: PA4780 family RIO1-like protein kinase [Pseudomonadales bacterium]|nr:PA4780 family RIO1-like protein kinase [Pseudomonadales bacterium]
MKIPPRLQPLVDDGLVDEVVERLTSGKEADVYVVRCGSELRCAKVYKDALQRSFKKATLYREGRRERSSRRARAMEKGSRFGRAQQEERWQSAELEALRRLAEAGVRVPRTYGVLDGVLLMELVRDEDGDVAPRLADVTMDEEQAVEDFTVLLSFVVRMLCAGLVHGDLSEFNVLVDADGPVIIDLPQAVDAAANQSARAMLLRDVANLRDYYGQFAPELLGTRYGEEIWARYEAGELHPELTLTGDWADPEDAADVDAVLAEIQAAIDEEEARRQRMADEDD